MKRRLLILLIGIILLFSPACSQTDNVSGAIQVIGEKKTVKGGSYQDISVAELKMMLENKDFLFVNTHIPFEGDIPNTDLSIPFDQIEQNLDKLPADMDAKIVLYCRSDRMSNIASETLVGLGYTNVRNLDGGMVSWEQAGLPIEGK